MQKQLEPALEERVLGEFERLAQLEDGSGIIEAELLEFVDVLGDVVFGSPRLRIASQTLLGEVLTGLGEDEAVADVLQRNLRDCGALPSERCVHYECARAAQVAVIRILRTIARMEALELRDVVKRFYETVNAVPPIQTALSFTMDVLDAAALDAHPDDMVRVVQDYADQILWHADGELNDYFAEVEAIVAAREANLRFGKSGISGVDSFGM